jgi:hypothetical protein
VCVCAGAVCWCAIGGKGDIAPPLPPPLNPLAGVRPLCVCGHTLVALLLAQTLYHQTGVLNIGGHVFEVRECECVCVAGSFQCVPVLFHKCV